MPTASRPGGGALATQFVHATERVRTKIMDLTRKEILFLNVSKKMGFYTETALPMAEIDPIIESKDVPVTTFSTGYEGLATNAAKGAQAVYVEYSNYSAPVAMSWVEEQKIRDPYRIISLAKVRLYKAGVALGERLEQDAFWGTATDALAISGLEQAVFPSTNIAAFATANAAAVSAALAGSRWQFRQGGNTYQGITRTAFTAEDVGGTHWENAALNIKGSVFSGAALTFGSLNDTMSKVMQRFYNVCSYGADNPDLIISTYRPYEDYLNLAAGVVNYYKVDSKIQDVNLGMGSARYKGAVWMPSERAQASGLTNSITAGTDMIYFLNTKYMRFEFSDTGNFELSDWARAPGSVAAVAQCLVRGQLIIDNPKYFGVIAFYGAA